jgi:hypothetical protein
MHHGILAHYTMQPLLFGEYIVDDWARISMLFANAGMRMVFTGHYHAQDVVKRTVKPGRSPSFIFDVETGSLVTYPVPYRLVTLDETLSSFRIESRLITQIDYDTEGIPFPQYAQQYLEDGLLVLSQTILVDTFGLDPATAQTCAPDVVKAFEANYVGDEKPDSDTLHTALSYMMMPDSTLKLIGIGILSLWDDLSPADNALAINLTSGMADPR